MRSPVHTRTLCGLLGPFAILLALFTLGPILAVGVLSFTDLLLGETRASFVGLRNYADLFDDYYFRHAFTNTLLYTAMVVPGATLLGLMCALLTAKAGLLARFYRTVFFMPVMASAVAMLLVWEYLLHPRLGAANALLGLLGLPGLGWLTDPATALPSLALIGIWQLFGVDFLLFSVALAQVPRSLYEAGAIDGIDNGVDRFLRITWPALRPMTAFVVLLTAIRSLQVFDAVQVLTQGGPGASTQVLLFNMYQEGFQFMEVGRAAAVAVIFLLLVIAPALARLTGGRRPAT